MFAKVFNENDLTDKLACFNNREVDQICVQDYKHFFYHKYLTSDWPTVIRTNQSD